jgi:hypothetical protein
MTDEGNNLHDDTLSRNTQQRKMKPLTTNETVMKPLELVNRTVNQSSTESGPSDLYELLLSQQNKLDLQQKQLQRLLQNQQLDDTSVKASRNRRYDSVRQSSLNINQYEDDQNNSQFQNNFGVMLNRNGRDMSSFSAAEITNINKDIRDLDNDIGMSS